VPTYVFVTAKFWHWNKYYLRNCSCYIISSWNSSCVRVPSLSSRVPYKNVLIKIQLSIVLPLELYGYKTSPRNKRTQTEEVKARVILRPTVSRPVYLGVKHPSGPQDQIFITLRQLRVCFCGAPTLTRGQVCRLQLLLVLASPVILASYSRGTHDHIVQCYGHLITSDHRLHRVMPLETPFGLLISLLQSQSHVTTFTHNYFSRCATFTRLTILHVRNYNHILHSYTFTMADFSAINYYLKLSHTLHLHTSRVCLLSRPRS
jgi:hypothetical protein